MSLRQIQNLTDLIKHVSLWGIYCNFLPAGPSPDGNSKSQCLSFCLSVDIFRSSHWSVLHSQPITLLRTAAVSCCHQATSTPLNEKCRKDGFKRIIRIQYMWMNLKYGIWNCHVTSPDPAVILWLGFVRATVVGPVQWGEGEGGDKGGGGLGIV